MYLEPSLYMAIGVLYGSGRTVCLGYQTASNVMRGRARWRKDKRALGLFYSCHSKVDVNTCLFKGFQGHTRSTYNNWRTILYCSYYIAVVRDN